MKNRRFVLFLLLAVVVVAVDAADVSTSNVDHTGTTLSSSKFLWLSDLHYDPYYGTSLAYGHKQCQQESSSSSSSSSSSYGQIGCDSPQVLIETILQHVKNVTSSSSCSSIDFVVITGDLSRHGNDGISNTPMNDTQSILYNVSHLLSNYLLSNDDDTSDVSVDCNDENVQQNNKTNSTTTTTKLVIIPSIGNNDVTPDYYIDIQHPTSMLQMIYNGMSPILPLQPPSSSSASASSSSSSSTVAATTSESTMKRGGYLAYNVTNQLTILSINTVIYSTKHMPLLQLPDDPLDQFVWLKQQLDIAKHSNRKVYIVGHIPPAIGSYRHAQFWHDKYLNQYYDILDTYYDDDDKVIVGQLFGHIHSDEFRLIQRQGSKRSIGSTTTTTTTTTTTATRYYPIYLAPSITPIYGSNPSFRIVEYRTTTATTTKNSNNVVGELLNYDTYYMNLLHNDGDEDDGNGYEGNNGSDGTSSSSSSTSTTNSNVVTFTKSKSFCDAYHVADLSSTSLQQVVHHLEASLLSTTNNADNSSVGSSSSSDTTTVTNEDSNHSSIGDSSYYWDTLLSRQHVYADGDADGNDDDIDPYKCDEYCRIEWLCTIKSTTRNEYNRCIASGVRTSSMLSRKAAAIAALLTVFGMISFLLIKYKIVSRKALSNRRQYQQAEHHDDHGQHNDHHDVEDVYHNGSDLNPSDNGDIAMMVFPNKPSTTTKMDMGQGNGCRETRQHPPEIT